MPEKALPININWKLFQKVASAIEANDAMRRPSAMRICFGCRSVFINRRRDVEIAEKNNIVRPNRDMPSGPARVFAAANPPMVHPNLSAT